MTRKIIAVVGATGVQGGGLVHAIQNDSAGEFAARALTRDINSSNARALAACNKTVSRAKVPRSAKAAGLLCAFAHFACFARV
jgi:hypothetical protein